MCRLEVLAAIAILVRIGYAQSPTTYILRTYIFLNASYDVMLSQKAPLRLSMQLASASTLAAAARDKRAHSDLPPTQLFSDYCFFKTILALRVAFPHFLTKLSMT